MAEGKKKPTLLSVECSSALCSVGLLTPEGVRYSCEGSAPNDHAVTLTPLIEQVLQKGNITASSLSAVAIGRGPGSYTGLRIGYSTVKGLALGLDIPLIEVSSLRSVAIAAKSLLTAKNTVTVGHILSTYKMRGDKIYAELFDWSLQPLHAGTIISPEDDWRWGDELCYICGSGTQFVPNHEKRVWVEKSLPPLALNLLDESLLRYERQEFSDVAYSTPFYVATYEAKKSPFPSFLNPNDTVV